MDIQFREYDGSFFALNPRIERRVNQLVIELDEQACTHFLILSHAPGTTADLRDPQLQEALRSRGEALLEADREALTEEITVSCVSYRNYRMNEKAIKIPYQITEYMIFGCRLLRNQEPEVFRVALPQEQMHFSTCVSFTVSYRLQLWNAEKSAAGKRGGRSFYIAEFEEVPDYQDGGIVYTLEGLPFSFPITKAMLGGQKLYIDAGRGMPKFQTTISGLSLRKI